MIIISKRTPEQARIYYAKNKERLRNHARKYYWQKRDQISERTAQRRIPNKERAMLNSARARANKSGLPFDITVDDIIIPAYCPIMGLKIETDRRGFKGNRDGVASLDRINNSKGYTKGNICVISYKANRCKADMSLDQIKRLYEYSIGKTDGGRSAAQISVATSDVPLCCDNESPH